jgi:hypothetical protein
MLVAFVGRGNGSGRPRLIARVPTRSASARFPSWGTLRRGPLLLQGNLVATTLRHERDADVPQHQDARQLPTTG